MRTIIFQQLVLCSKCKRGFKAGHQFSDHWIKWNKEAAKWAECPECAYDLTEAEALEEWRNQPNYIGWCETLNPWSDQISAFILRSRP